MVQAEKIKEKSIEPGAFTQVAALCHINTLRHSPRSSEWESKKSGGKKPHPTARRNTVGGGANAKPPMNTNALNLADPAEIVIVQTWVCEGTWLFCMCVSAFGGSCCCCCCSLSLCSGSVPAGPRGQKHTQIRHQDVGERKRGSEGEHRSRA